MVKYQGCEHDWKCRYEGSLAAMRCEKCNLQVMIFSDHVSVWNFSGEVGDYLGRLNFPPDPEDEEATELEPEEVTVDAEGGG